MNSGKCKKIVSPLGMANIASRIFKNQIEDIKNIGHAMGEVL